MMPGLQVRSPQRTPAWRRLTRLDAPGATGWYLVLTVALTWPLSANLATRLPNDLGDPLLGCWLLQWNFDHLLAVAHGDFGAIGRYWNATYFHPAPLALLYSEHLFALGVQALPVWLATHNLLLCYNLLVLSAFVLAGLGTFLLVRALTGNARAAFVAGLFYAFTPYRFAQLGHIQVLSSQWMPFVLYGLHEFFERGQPGGAYQDVDRALHAGLSGQHQKIFPTPLALASVALIAQNLSCGYYLVYFAPFVAAYVLWEIARRGLWRSWRTWGALLAAGALVVGACAPFLLKYHQLRLLGFEPRSVDELRTFSADTFGYLRTLPASWLWGDGFKAVDKPEGQLFPGLAPVALALVGLFSLGVALRRRSLAAEPVSGWRLAVAAPALVVGIGALEFARFELFAGDLIWRVRATWPWLADIRHVFLVIAACAAILVAASPRARVFARLALSSRTVLFAAFFCMAVWLSFGPLVTTFHLGIAPDALYGWLYRHIPGFNGLRVPARYGMLAMLFLAVVAGRGAAAVDEMKLPRRNRGRVAWNTLLLATVAAFFLLETATMPLRVVPIAWPRRDGIPGSVTAAELQRLYRFAGQLPHGTVIVEFPFGGVQAETRAVYFSTLHRHPILNGYSGGAPRSYGRQQDLLADPVVAGDAAWQELLNAGATVAIVHEWAFAGTGPALCDWLQAHGARPLATFKSDRMFQIPPRAAR